MAVIAVASIPEAASVELLEPVPDGSGLVSCPLCHTTHQSLTRDAVETGGDWRCTRCGQRWDARRLATVAAYAAWVIRAGHKGSRERRSRSRERTAAASNERR
jgi:transcription elongation factor Elf1